MCNNPVLREVSKGRFVETRCSNCLGCRLDNQALWQARCNSEFIKYRSSFVTFTYDDLHLNYRHDYSLMPSLSRFQFHKFIDNLRHKVKSLNYIPSGCIRDFKYFCSGEYGDSFGRPHYHALFFGLDFVEMRKIYSDLWKNGSVKSLPILSGGIRYVVDYMLKCSNGPLAEIEFDDTDRERPFSMYSKGLGFDFFYAHKDEINFRGNVRIGSRLVPVPTYYKNIFQDFSLVSVYSRLHHQLESYKNVLSEMKEFKFTDYDLYVKYKRKNLELSLAKRHPDLVPSYNSLESLGDGYIPPLVKYYDKQARKLAEEAINA